jgi:hypothetical protein
LVGYELSGICGLGGRIEGGVMAEEHRRADRVAAAGIDGSADRGHGIAGCVQPANGLAVGLEYAGLAVGDEPTLGAQIGKPERGRVKRRLVDPHIGDRPPENARS